MAQPGEMLERLEHAIATPWWRRTAMAINVPTLLGEKGRPLPPDEFGPQYGYTRAQCKRMKALIVAALRANMEIPE